jgi:hypothetical protein
MKIEGGSYALLFDLFCVPDAGSTICCWIYDLLLFL